MAAEFISASAITWASGANPAGQSQTVPSDATAAINFWAYYTGADGNGLSTITLDSVSPVSSHETPTAATDQTGTGVSIWFNPATGSRTLDPAWDAAPEEGPTGMIAYAKGVDTSAWRDADADNQDGATASSVTLTTQVGDIVFKYDQRFGTPPSLSAGWTNCGTTSNNGEGARLSYIIATGTTQVCASEDENYSSVCAISIPAASGGTTISTGMATETDAAMALSAGKVAAAGRADEADNAQAPTLARLVATGRSDEIDAALALAALKLAAVGQASETDSAVAPSLLKSISAAVAGEADGGLALELVRVLVVDSVTEAEAAQALALLKFLSTGVAVESDAALALAFAGGVTVTAAEETDAGLALTLTKLIAPAQAAESDAALVPALERVLGIGLATESNSARAAEVAKLVAAGLAAEVDMSLALALAGPLEVGLAVEMDQATALSFAGTAPPPGGSGSFYAPRPRRRPDEDDEEEARQRAGAEAAESVARQAEAARQKVDAYRLTRLRDRVRRMFERPGYAPRHPAPKASGIEGEWVLQTAPMALIPDPATAVAETVACDDAEVLLLLEAVETFAIQRK
jgi:hypothetical protein